MKPRRRWPRRLFQGLVILLLLALGGFGWVGSSHLLSPPRRALQDYHREILSDPDRFGLAVEAWTAPGDTPALIVRASSRPGTATKSRELRRRLAHAPPWRSAVGTVVLLHGHQGRKEDHLPICERFCAAGFRCILIDLPGHGDHPSRFATFGHREAGLLAEIRASVDDGHPFFLFGVSQGGAVALQAAARDPGLWDGVISAAAFASLGEIVTDSARQLHPVLRPAAPLVAASVEAFTFLRAGFLPSAIRPADAIRSLDRPVLLIHGDGDRYIPLDHARRLHAALPGTAKALRIIPGAGHGRVLAADADNTYAACCEFMLEAAR